MGDSKNSENSVRKKSEVKTKELSLKDYTSFSENYKQFSKDYKQFSSSIINDESAENHHSIINDESTENHHSNKSTEMLKKSISDKILHKNFSKFAMKNPVSSENNASFLLSVNFLKRVVLGIAMLIGFFWLCSGNPIKLVSFVIFLTIGVFFELICLIRVQNSEFPLRPALTVYMAILIYTGHSLPSVRLIYPNLREILPICRFRVMFFYAYSIGFVIFIWGLKRGNLRSQILLFMVLHLAGGFMGMTCNITVSNILKGKYYFIFPVILVITNDVAAYFFGKLFGKTKLFPLSPKKTVEGFVGGFLSTAILGIIISKGYDRIFDRLAFIIAASFLAPFMGLFGSAIKRLFKKKDFGSIIPGHGGITDRMDCQILMAWFTYYYLQGTSGSKERQIGNIISYIVKNFTEDEISEIISRIKQN